MRCHVIIARCFVVPAQHPVHRRRANVGLIESASVLWSGCGRGCKELSGANRPNYKHGFIILRREFFIAPTFGKCASLRPCATQLLGSIPDW